MAKQARLELWEDGLAALWWRLPERARRAVIEHYARLIARAAQASRTKPGVRKS